MTLTFDHQDAEYQHWTDRNQHGFVVNAYRNLDPGYLMLHRTRCHTISGTPARGRTWTEGEFVKICPETLQDTEEWAGAETEGTLKPCFFCKPGRSSSGGHSALQAGRPIGEPTLPRASASAPKQRTTSQIPDFQSREEEAEFWDTHEVTNYFGELRPVRVTPMPGLSAGMTVRLDPEDREALGRIAATRGVGPSTLVRMWIKERLRAES